MKRVFLAALGPAFVLAMFAGAMWLLRSELQQYQLQDFLDALAGIPRRSFWLAIGLTALNYAIMTGYDQLAIRYIGHPLPPRRVALGSFLGYALGNNFGTFVGGSTVRFRLYTAWGLSAIEIVKLVLMLGVTFWTGLFALGGAVLLIEPLPIPPRLHLPLASTRPLGALLAGVAAAYLMLCATRRSPLKLGKWSLAPPPLRLALMQLGVATLDLLVAASILYVLLPASISVTYLNLLAVYLLSLVASLLTQVPGGIGVRELVLLVMLAPSQPEDLVAALLAHRLVYYLMPLGVGLLVLLVNELAPQRQRARRVAKLFESWAPVVAPRLLGFTVFASGAVLLLSGATPAVDARMEVLRRTLPLPVIEVSHFLGSVVGVLLLVLARGLQRRIESAYWLSVALLSAGVVLSLLKGFDYEEALVLSLMLTAILPCRRHFYRKGALLSRRFSPGWFVAIAIVLGAIAWLMLFAYQHVEYSDELWWRFAFDGDAPRSLRASIGALLVAMVVAFARLIRAQHPPPRLPTAEELELAAAIVDRSADTTAHLALLGDKHLLFNDERTAMVMFGVEGKSWVSMGDPVGPRDAADELAWDFRELCDEGGRWPVFYQVDEDRLSTYVEMGLTLIKLGEEARVPLAEFGLEGGPRKDLRKTVKRVAAAGCSFELVEPPGVDAVLEEMEQVSNAWLLDKKGAEKGFSLGFFEPGYVRRCPAALVRQDGRLIALANVWSGAERAELSVDLMRFVPDSPPGVMDYLLIELMLWGREEGYAWFSLGMAPLAGIEAEPLAPLWNRVAAATFRYGEPFYNFQGLRQYKDKFDPVWRPKYLASPGGLALPVILVNLTTLISGGLGKLVKRD